MNTAVDLAMDCSSRRTRRRMADVVRGPHPFSEAEIDWVDDHNTRNQPGRAR